ncbi:MAG: hypothetical protein Tsb0013_20450 [Phycisphaerales bacterium]
MISSDALYRLAAVLVVGVVSPTCLAQLGSLTPPPGTITETMKPLDVVEARTPVGPDTTPGDTQNVFIIDKPGSYYLVADVVGETGKNGISITVDDVTLDLNGFTVRASPFITPVTVRDARDNEPAPAPRGGATGTGIFMENFRRNVNIMNGAVTGWSEDGIRFLSDGGRLHNIHAYANGCWGVDADGDYVNTITDCRFQNNGVASIPRADQRGTPVSAGGLRAGFGAVIARCTSIFDTTGFVLGDGAMITDSTVSQFFVTGIRVEGQGVRISDCALTLTFGAGDPLSFIHIQSSATRTHITACTIQDGNNSSNAVGIRIEGTYAVIEDSSIYSQGTSIDVDAEYAVVKRNTIQGTKSSAIDAGNADAFGLTIDSNEIGPASGLQARVVLVDSLAVVVTRNLFRGNFPFVTSTTGNRVAETFSASDPAATSPFANFRN